MELEQEKGCVYFFKHSGLNPIKIGYSSNKSPIKRFNQFKTYAPYGAEIIGFILSSNSKELEIKLHEKFSQYRLEGEWFDITIEIVEKEIELQSSIEDLKLKTEFQLQWAKKLNENKQIENDVKEAKKQSTITKNLFNNKKEQFFDIYKNNKDINKTSMADLFGVSRKTIYEWINDYNKQ